jgi:TP901 family phage tail tape measure protein
MAKIILNVDLQAGGAEQELAKFKKSIQGLGDPKGVKNIDNLRKGYANLINTIQGTEKNYKKGTFTKILEEAKDGLNNLKDPANQTTEGLNKLDISLKKLQADFAETKAGATNFKGTLTDLVLGFGKFQLAAMLVMKPLQMLQQEFEHMNEVLVETESLMVKIRRVAGESANSDAIYDLAIKYSEEFANVADVVERFAKAGYSWEDSLLAAESALTAMKVAELDSEQATEGLIAVMKQFGLEIRDLNDLVDMLNKTADNYAVDTDELLIALQKTGSTAKNAGLDVKETIGLITALSEGTAASGQNIGNALRSLFVFTSDDKALDTFAGMSAGMAQVVKDYQAGKASILDVWQALGTEVADKQDFKSAFGGVNMSEDMEAQLTQIEDQLAEIYGTAGNYRQNYFIALLDNIDTAKKAIEDTGDSANYSQKELNEELNTYENRLASLDQRWEKILNNEQGFLGFKKDLLLIGEVLLDNLETLQEINKAFSELEIGGVKIKAGVLPSLWANASEEQKKDFLSVVTNLGSPTWSVNLGKIIGNKISGPKPNVKVAVKTAADVSKYTGKIKEDTEDIFITLSQLSSNTLSSIADKFKEIRDATQEAYDFEEKKKAVLEAEQALADAYNEREVRIYNAQTGRWEMKSRQADIQKAQENLDKARLDAENSAYNEIIKDLESGNTTNEAILAIIAKWQGAYGNGDFSHVSESVKKVLSEFGVDLTNSKAEEKSEVTDKPDTIPEMIEKLNKKIFEEVSDEEFAKNVKEKQLLFGTSKSIASAVGNLIYNNPRTNNDSHNVIMNGITIPRDVAQGHSILDIFSLIPLLGD